jgi:two-component system, NtrC family, response regulator AtoC
MSTPVLVVDDDRSVRHFLQEALSSHGFRVVTCDSAGAAVAALDAEDFAVVATDLRMPRQGWVAGGPGDGLGLCRQIVAMRPDLPVVVITAFGSLETAVAAIRAGAYDFITKPFDIELLTVTLERAVRHRALRDEVRRLRSASDGAPSFEGLIGSSPPMKKLYALLDRVADSDSSVMIAGESGTGKELVARAIHRRSARACRPLVAINCAAVPEALLESELFGHARGAFTDARGSRPGLFVAANGGTLFLDELGDLPLGLQPKLLRALQERRVRPLGGEAEIPFDVRVVAASNRKLESLVEQKRFREDLYYRVSVIPIELPALRARGSDILLLAQSFIAQLAARTGKPIRGISQAAAGKLLAYHWPGNVRELQNCIERAVTLALFDQIGVDDLPEKIRDHHPSRASMDGDALGLMTLDELERRHVLRVLESSGGNRTAAARILGLDRTTLWRKLERYGASCDPS